MRITEICRWKKDGVVYVGGKPDGEILERMKVIIVDEGKELYHNGENIGTSALLKGDESEYEERTAELLYDR